MPQNAPDAIKPLDVWAAKASRKRPLKRHTQAMSVVYPRLDNEDYDHQPITRRHRQ